jgi:two-component system, OmpR family, sensor histidine kinase BaeS
MRSLSYKITLGFVFVSLTGTVLAALFIFRQTRLAFDRFLINRDRSTLVTALTHYYQSTGSWNDVESIFRSVNEPGDNQQFLLPGYLRDRFDLHLPHMLVDVNGDVVYAPTEWQNHPVSAREIKNGVVLKLNDQTIGWLVEAPTDVSLRPESPEGVFLKSVSRAILFSAIGTLLIALLLGGILSASLTRPLRELVAATKNIALGKLGYQVEVRSKDELGELTSSFNQMSSDLERSNELRKQMTADIAHDLRSPLSVIMGYTEALSDGKLSGSPEIYTTMHLEAQHLSHLIDDLRILSLADAGELPLERQWISPQDMLRRAAAAHAHQAQARDISLLVDVQPELPLLHVDPDRMAQVLGNLVSNALRYTQAGGWIKLSAQSRDGAVVMTVSDNGSGISPEDLPHVFSRFYRGDKSRYPNGEVGLGLAIARSLVQAQGGRISVHSQPGQGATFTIQLPEEAGEKLS